MLSKEHLHYIELFIKNINENIHFSYGHFNDGEMSIIMGSNDPISRGDQKSSSELRKKLITSLIFEKENYFVGIPCALCHKFQRLFCELLRLRNVPATVFHHTKLTHLNAFLDSLKNKRLYWVVSESKNLNAMKKYELDIENKIIVPPKNAFSVYETIKHEIDNIKDNSIVLLLCGPLGRILAQEWFDKKNNVTYLCIGSYFDSILENRTYLYDTENHNYCFSCSPNHKQLT
jgi:hypothetical protein